MPAMIPWPIMVVYFATVITFVILFSWKRGGLSRFKTVDLVYIGVGSAFTVVWEFFVGPLLDKIVPSGLAAYISFGFFGRILIVLIIAGLVRKVGTGMLSLAIFDVLGDIFHYGFGGEPIFMLYEAFTYGLFIDLAIAVSRGHLFGVGLEHKVSSRKNIFKNEGAKTPTSADPPAAVNPPVIAWYSSPRFIAGITGALIGLLWATPDSFIYGGFFEPLLYGGIVDWSRLLFSFVAFIPGDVAFGIIAGLLAARIARVLGQ
ncbi:MAG: hypothetical protein QW292_04155 [Candidatus Parvarchaeota archaeon]